MLVSGLKSRVFKERITVGLDIGTHAIKIVKLKLLRDKVELCDFDLKPAQPDLLDTLKNIKQLQDAKTVNTALSGPSTVIRYVSFPRMNKDELKQALRFEAQKHIPFSLAEINLDGCILKGDLPDNKMLVLIAAAKKESIDQRLKLMEDAGLKVNILDIDSLSLINAFNFNYSKDDELKHKTIALLNIGASISNLNILEDDLPRLSRDIHIAGNNLTQKIVDTLGLDVKSAEELKLNPDNQSLSKITATLESVLSNLANEIRLSLDYYESQSTSSVAKIFLSGGASKFSGLKGMLANILGIEVEYWDPLKQIILSSEIDSKEAETLSGQLAVAVGLALR